MSSGGTIEDVKTAVWETRERKTDITSLENKITDIKWKKESEQTLQENLELETVTKDIFEKIKSNFSRNFDAANTDTYHKAMDYLETHVPWLRKVIDSNWEIISSIIPINPELKNIFDQISAMIDVKDMYKKNLLNQNDIRKLNLALADWDFKRNFQAYEKAGNTLTEKIKNLIDKNVDEETYEEIKKLQKNMPANLREAITWKNKNINDKLLEKEQTFISTFTFSPDNKNDLKSFNYAFKELENNNKLKDSWLNKEKIETIANAVNTQISNPEWNE